MRLVYADPPYLGQCASYDHFHNEGGEMPWDGKCWNYIETHEELFMYLRDCDGFAYSCNPDDLSWVTEFLFDARVAAWTKTWHQIRPTTVQYAWEPVLFAPGRKDNGRTPMVRDWLSCVVTKQTGQRGAKPEAFNEWILDLLCYEEGDEFVDLFPGSGSMARALRRHEQRLSAPERDQETE